VSRVLALTWFGHRRTSELCAGLDVELVVVTTTFRGLLRYAVLTARTIGLLARHRPDTLLVQNPSLVLAAVAVAIRPWLRYRLIVDAHNEAIVPFIHRQEPIVRLSRWVIRRADLTIVTNRQLAAIVVGIGGRPFTLPDRIPAPPDVPVRHLAGDFNAVLVATFAPDEPIAQVFEAVRGTSVQLYVTGNCSKLEQRTTVAAPDNVHFTGFLDEHDYWSLLRSADAVVDLTVMSDCLVCGAYEALALCKPMLLSNNTASIELFGGCAVFTDNSAHDIRTALERLRSERASLQAAAELKRRELGDLWAQSAQVLRKIVTAFDAGESQSVG
jgi:glycosyltransferase involved in cell wall biosynthesis